MAKYTIIPTADPELHTTLDFSSIFTYNNAEYFPYSKADSKKIRSAFTYSHLDTTFQPNPNMDSVEPSTFGRFCSYVLTIVFYIIIFLTFPISWILCVKRLQQHERMLVFRLGYKLALKGPGVVIVLPCIDKIHKVDLRTKAFSVPPLQVVTTEGSIIEVGAEILYHIKDGELALTNVHDYNHSTRMLAHAAMQKNLKMYDIKGIERSKFYVAQELRDDMNRTTLNWGIEIGSVELSHIKLIAEGTDNNLGDVKNVLQVLGQAFFGNGGRMPTDPILVPAHGKPVIWAPSGATLMGPGGDGPPSVQQSTDLTSNTQGCSSRPNLTSEDLLQQIQPILCEKLVQDFQTVYKFCVKGQDNSVVYYLDLKNGSGAAALGEPPTPPNVTLMMSSSTLSELLHGRLSPVSAYMSGLLEVEGDISSARRLQELFELLNL